MKLILSAFALFIGIKTWAQTNYWQQDVSYTINAELNDVEHSITGFETIVYKNNSPSTLDFIWFHIWPNAYKNQNTALIQQIKNDKERSKKAEFFGVGSIDGLDFKVNNQAIKTEAHSNPQYIDIIKLVLNSPLKPGESITITTPFKVILPPYFSRSGYADGEFMACQWYPKPAVYDKNGWHEFPYLDMGEFYSEYATFKVSITLPSEYIVAATGTLKTADELERYKSLGTKNAKKRKSKAYMYSADKSKPTKTLSYEAENVLDFAWFADKKYAIQYDTILLPSGKVIDAFSYYYPKKKTPWINGIDYIKDGLRHYSTWIGEYAYPVVQAVEGPKNNSSGGMEYPMVTLITSPDAKVETLDAVITHEVGHNWFMGMLGTNERDHAWMDEGLNTYFQFRYEAEKYRSNSIFGNQLPKELKTFPADQFLKIIYDVINKNLPLDAPMETSSANFASSDEYGIIAYVKTATWMHQFELLVGKENCDKAIQNYFKKWKFKHPQPEDMQAAFEEATGKKLDQLFQLTRTKGNFKQ